MRLITKGLSIGVLGVFASGSASQPGEPARVKVDVVPSAEAVAPGGSIDLALVFAIDDGWHTYAPAQNDTGLAARVEWTVELDAGVEFGEMLWPVATRYTQPGDILDHVYEDEAVVLQPVSIPSDAEPGSIITLTGDLEWLVCDARLCIAEWQTVVVQIPVTGRTSETANDTVTRARGALPPPFAADTSVGVDVTWTTASTVEFRAERGGRLSFIPLDGSPRVADLLATGVSDQGVLRIRFETPDAEGRSGTPRLVSGWLTHTPETGSPQSWLFEAPLGGMSNPGVEAGPRRPATDIERGG